MSKEDRLERIEQYLRGELSGVEREVFEEALSIDPELKKEYLFQKELFDAIGNPRYDHMETAIRQADQRYFGEQPAQNGGLLKAIPKGWWAAVAASILVGAFGLWWLLGVSQAPQYADLYEPFDPPTLFRGEAVLEVPEDLLLGLSFYEEGNFAEARKYLEPVVSENPDQFLAQLLLGVSWLELEDYPKAEAVLGTLSDTEGHTLQGPALWYLALSQWQLDKPVEAKASLDELISLQEGEWSHKAKTLRDSW